jgi:RNA polymerase-binding transcription factor DksA
MIDERHEALESEIHRDAARSRDEPYSLLAGEVTDVGDSASADLIADLGNAELSRDLEELRALEAAQERIDGGSYGSCLDCGGEIEFERLLAQPTALRCLDCERVHERTYAHASQPKL